MTFDDDLATTVARANMRDFLVRNSGRWEKAEARGEVGQFVVLPPGLAPCAVWFTDHHGNAVNVANLAPGYVYRIRVEVVEEVSREDIEGQPP